MVVGFNDPFNFCSLFFLLIDTGRGGGLGARSRRNGGFCWLCGLLDLNTNGAECTIEGTLLRDGVVKLQWNVNSVSNPFWRRWFDLALNPG